MPHLFHGQHVRVHARCRDRVRHLAETADDNIIANGELPTDGRTTADHAAPANARTAGDADAGRDRGMRADADVVPNLDQVVEGERHPRSPLSPSAPRSMVVLAPISTSSPKAHAAELRPPSPTARHRVHCRNIRADHDSGMHDATRTDAATGEHRGALGEGACPHRAMHPRPRWHAQRPDSAHRSRRGLDDHAGTNLGTGIDLCVRMPHCRGWDAGLQRRLRMQGRGNPRKKSRADWRATARWCDRPSACAGARITAPCCVVAQFRDQCRVG